MLFIVAQKATMRFLSIKLGFFAKKKIQMFLVPIDVQTSLDNCTNDVKLLKVPTIPNVPGKGEEPPTVI